MRKVLLGGCALVGLLAASANAAEPIKLEVGGKMNQWFGYVNHESDPQAGITMNNFAHASDTEVHFAGSTKLDNGLKVTAKIELEAERTVNGGTGGRNANQQYLEIESPYGVLSLGERLDVQDRMHNAAPRFGVPIDILRSFVAPRSNNVVGTAPFDATSFDSVNTAAGNRIDYITPQFAGFNIGVGYTARPNDRGVANEAASNHDFLSAAVAYTGTFSGLAVGADFGVFRMDAVNSTAPSGGTIKGFSGGIKLGYAGFIVGGSLMRAMDDLKSEDGTGTSGDGYSWDAGLAYETDRYGIALTYYHERQEATMGTRGQDKGSYLALAAKYQLVPSAKDAVLWQTSVNRLSFKDETRTDANDTSGWAVISGFSLAF